MSSVLILTIQAIVTNKIRFKQHRCKGNKKGIGILPEIASNSQLGRTAGTKVVSLLRDLTSSPFAVPLTHAHRQKKTLTGWVLSEMDLYLLPVTPRRRYCNWFRQYRCTEPEIWDIGAMSFLSIGTYCLWRVKENGWNEYNNMDKLLFY